MQQNAQAYFDFRAQEREFTIFEDIIISVGSFKVNKYQTILLKCLQQNALAYFDFREKDGIVFI